MKRFYWSLSGLIVVVIMLFAAAWHLDTPVGKQHEHFFIAVLIIHGILAAILGVGSIFALVDAIENE